MTPEEQAYVQKLERQLKRRKSFLMFVLRKIKLFFGLRKLATVYKTIVKEKKVYIQKASVKEKKVYVQVTPAEWHGIKIWHYPSNWTKMFIAVFTDPVFGKKKWVYYNHYNEKWYDQNGYEQHWNLSYAPIYDAINFKIRSKEFALDFIYELNKRPEMIDLY